MPNSTAQHYGMERMMADQNFLLAYRDVITEDSVQQLLDVAEMKLMMHGSGKKLRKRVFNILVECLQNIVNHADHSTGASASLLLIGKSDQMFIVRTGNMVRNTEVGAVTDKLDYVNSMGQTNIRVHYNAQLGKSEFTQKGGAGLGLMDIYRRSGNPIDYAVRPVDAERSFLSLSICVSNEGE